MITACTEDLTDEIAGTSGGSDEIKYTTYTTTTGGYISPWDNNRIPVGYNFQSNIVNTSQWVNGVFVQGLHVRITPYIGLAYYDGADDGDYFGTNLASGAYPNLYASGREYGNYVEANPIVLWNGSGGTPPWNNHELFIQSTIGDHCPLINVPIGYNYNLYATGFDIQNNATVQPAAYVGNTLIPAPAAGTGAEEDLLRKYGKVMYYKIEYGTDAFNFYPNDVYYVIALEVNEDIAGSANWKPLPDASTQILDSFKAPMYYHYDSNTPANTTYEIVVDKKQFRDADPNYRRWSGDVYTLNTDGSTRKVITMGTTGYIDIQFE